jgi:hypothetical protein
MAGGEEHFDQIATAATDVSTAAEDFGNGLDTLTATVTTDNPWGADGPGTVFGMAYTGLLGHALEVLESHWGLLAEGAVKLDTWSGNSRATEDGNNQTVTSVNNQLDGVQV